MKCRPPKGNGDVGERPPGQFCRWMGAASSERGRGHRAQGLPCQDRCDIWLGVGGAGIVVSDGAGSAKRSEYGAEIVVEVTAGMLRDRTLWHDHRSDVGVRIVDACREEMGNRAEDLECPVSDLAATVAFVTVAGDEMIAGNLGDGVVVAFSTGAVDVLIAPDRGEFANETAFVTSSDAGERLRIVRKSREDYDGFAVISDGAGESLYQRRTGSVAPAFLRIFSWLEEFGSKKVRDAFAEQVMPLLIDRTQDDCTLAVMRRTCVYESEIDGKAETLQMELLCSGNRRGLKNRLAVLDGYGRGLDDDGVSRDTGLSKRTVRSHRRAVANLRCPQPAPPEPVSLGRHLGSAVRPIGRGGARRASAVAPKTSRPETNDRDG